MIRSFFHTLAATGKLSLGKVALSVAASKAFVTRKAPFFDAPGVVDNKPVESIKISDYKSKYLLLFFYPLDFTFVCPTELISFSERLDDFRAEGCEVAGVSVDSPYAHLAWLNTPKQQGGIEGVRYPLISDMTHKIGRDYGVYHEPTGVNLRGMFLIDPNRILRAQIIHENSIGRSVDEALRVVRAVVHTDKTKDLCPAGWNPGMETIDPSCPRTFFQKKRDKDFTL